MQSRQKRRRGTASGSPEIVNRLIHDHGQLKSYKRHETIYAVGDPAEHVYLISTGDVKLSRFAAEGRELILDFLTPGSLFGESEILLGKSRNSRATARTPLLAYQFEQAELMKLMQSDPEAALWLTQQMVIRQSRMEDRLESLLFKSAAGKVAHLLLSLAENHGRHTGEGTVIDYPITHQEIGNLIATTRETVSYAFMDFRKQGLISSQKRKTVVHDMPGLGKMALN